MEAPDRPHRLLRFGIFEVDLAAEELRKSGMRVRVAPQAFQVLRLLIEHPGHIVTREDLRQALWTADTFVEFDRGLNNTVSRLRELLDDSPTSPRFIETVPRRGYRFIAPVEADAVSVPIATPAAAPVTPAPPPLTDVPAEVAMPARRRRPGWIVLGAAAIVVCVLGAWWWRSRSAHPLETRALAVLPLGYKALPGQPADTYLADGLTDALITELSNIGTMRVISETSSRRYRDTTKSLPEIARELGVDTVVEGSVFREGDVIRVTVQLIRADTDSHVWAQTYTRGIGSLLALQRDVALAIASEIGARMSPEERTRLSAGGSANPEAYRLYVLGHQLVAKAFEPEVYEALDHFQRALEIDPNYARAYLGIGESWIALSDWSRAVPPLEGFPRAKAAALKALALDPSMADAHTALAYVTEVFDWNFAAAEGSYKTALTLSPNNALAHERYSLFLLRTGRPNEGLAEAQRAFELNPLSLENNIGLAQRLFDAGRREEAIAAMEKTIKMDPGYFDPWVHLAGFYASMGRREDSEAAARRGLELANNAAHARQMVALAYLSLGRKADAQAILSDLKRPGSRRDPFTVARISADLGDMDEALRWFAIACNERSTQMAFFQLIAPRKTFDPVRSDPRFRALLSCGGTPTTKPVAAQASK
jgi:TolB-like protein/DNA-binding winged helix-turn-helix (wHTH) protein/Flp pilus assembly protein TadD